MRSDTFEGDEEIIEWAEKLSGQEAHDRDVDNRISMLVIGICFIGIILGTFILG